MSIIHNHRERNSNGSSSRNGRDWRGHWRNCHEGSLGGFAWRCAGDISGRIAAHAIGTPKVCGIGTRTFPGSCPRRRRWLQGSDRRRNYAGQPFARRPAFHGGADTARNGGRRRRTGVRRQRCADRPGCRSAMGRGSGAAQRCTPNAGHRRRWRRAGRWRHRAWRLGSGLPSWSRDHRHSRRTLHLR